MRLNFVVHSSLLIKTHQTQGQETSSTNLPNNFCFCLWNWISGLDWMSGSLLISTVIWLSYILSHTYKRQTESNLEILFDFYMESKVLSKWTDDEFPRQTFVWGCICCNGLFVTLANQQDYIITQLQWEIFSLTIPTSRHWYHQMKSLSKYFKEI